MELSSSIQLLIVGAIAYSIAQVLKFVIALRKDGIAVSDMFASGGMPSSHASVTTSIAIFIGFIEGFDSTIFGLAVIVAAIVMYDALGVRRSNGENGDAIARIVKDLKLKGYPKMSVLGKGHTPPEVIVGASIGALIAYIGYLILV